MLGEEAIRKMIEKVRLLIEGECQFEYLTAVNIVLNEAKIPQKDRGYYINIMAP